MASKKPKNARKPEALVQSLITASPIMGLTVNTEEAVRLAVRTARGTVAGNVTVTVRSAVWDDATTEQERAEIAHLARDIGTVCLAWTLKERKPL